MPPRVSRFSRFETTFLNVVATSLDLRSTQSCSETFHASSSTHTHTFSASIYTSIKPRHINTRQYTSVDNLLVHLIKSITDTQAD